MKNNIAVFDKIFFPINPELNNRSSYKLIRYLANTFRSEVAIVGSSGSENAVDAKKELQLNEEIESLKEAFDGKSESEDRLIKTRAISQDFHEILAHEIAAERHSLVVFTVPFLITSSNKAYVDLIERSLATKRVSFLLIPEKADISSFEKVTITSHFNQERLRLAISIADFVQDQLDVRIHLLNLLVTDEKSNSLIASYISSLKDTEKPAKLSYSNKRLNINALTIDKASSIDSDLVVRIVRDELSDIRIQHDSGGVATFNATPVLLIFE